ncbi:MAG: acireductone synthase [Pirellulales bacterium]
MKFDSIQCVLLDIEGTTSSIAFVYDIMFAYIREHLDAFLRDKIDSPELDAVIALMREDLQDASWCSPSIPTADRIALVASQVRQWMDEDRKLTGLKKLQGMIWKGGFETGQMRAHVFPDVLPNLLRWKDLGLEIRIYSSGSIQAQKLFFGHSESGNLLPYFISHYDTTIGNKRESASYQRIAADIGTEPNRVLFVSDVAAELDAAREAGMQAVACCRVGNAPLPSDYTGSQITSFDQIEIA